VSESLPVSLAMEIADSLHRLSRYRLRRRAALPVDMLALKERMDRSYPGRAALRATDYALLREVAIILARAPGPVSMGDLGRALDVPLSTATRIVDWLVANGYVERQTDPDDRRVVRVALSEAGWEVSRAMRAYVQEQMARWLRHFTPDEGATLALLLRKLSQALEEEG